MEGPRERARAAEPIMENACRRGILFLLSEDAPERISSTRRGPSRDQSGEKKPAWLEIKAGLSLHRPIQVRMTATSGRCKKFAAPQVCKYAGNQINNQMSAAQRTPPGILVWSGEDMGTFSADAGGHPSRTAERIPYATATPTHTKCFLNGCAGGDGALNKHHSHGHVRSHQVGPPHRPCRMTAFCW